MVRRALNILSLCSLITLPVVAADPWDVPARPETGPEELTESIENEIERPTHPNDWWNHDQLLGEMGGLRPWLSKYGMTFELNSYDEGFANPDGGLNAETGQRYAGLTDFLLSFDTEAVGWWKGGLFVVDLQNTRGGDISDFVGDAQGISNIVAPPGTRFAEYHLIQEFSGGKLALKIGKQDANADFVVSEGGSEFINSSFGIIPTVPLPTFPAPALGVMGAWQATGQIRLKAGIWDGTPVLGSGAFGTAFDGSGGTVGAVGLEIAPFGVRILSGTYRIGVWRHSEVEIADPPTATTEPGLGPARGAYFTVDQGLWENDRSRLAIFAQGGWGETDRSAFSRYFGGGFTFNAPFRGRPDDIVGIGIARAELGDVERLHLDSTAETVFEFFYKLPLTGWMTMNPDLQWIHRPNGVKGTAFVAGLRVATVF